jgi:hypothetical protein
VTVRVNNPEIAECHDVRRVIFAVAAARSQRAGVESARISAGDIGLRS